mmetsp:Transcript_6502/g.18961  ORF Transcript_6502/g.18961 Transcript_6502/m.18961 type:complete len:236 (-) Transcript_6502:73-780(-)
MLAPVRAVPATRHARGGSALHVGLGVAPARQPAMGLGRHAGRLTIHAWRAVLRPVGAQASTPAAVTPSSDRGAVRVAHTGAHAAAHGACELLVHAPAARARASAVAGRAGAALLAIARVSRVSELGWGRRLHLVVLLRGRRGHAPRAAHERVRALLRCSVRMGGAALVVLADLVPKHVAVTAAGTAPTRVLLLARHGRRRRPAHVMPLATARGALLHAAATPPWPPSRRRGKGWV